MDHPEKIKDPIVIGHPYKPPEMPTNYIGPVCETFTPTLDRVLVKPSPLPQYQGKVHVDRSQEPPVQGVVVAVGPGPYTRDLKGWDWTENADVRRSRGASSLTPAAHPPHAPGDVVVFGKYAGTELALNGEKHLILGEKDILGIVYRVPAGAQSAEPTLVALSSEGV